MVCEWQKNGRKILKAVAIFSGRWRSTRGTCVVPDLRMKIMAGIRVRLSRSRQQQTNYATLREFAYHWYQRRYTVEWALDRMPNE
ncbi:hypothetical protein RR46_08715 [Papilio xuthus]|uniref:Uncharacterized protein n=1 Tax=Papilio xuthus TaxID=66420 RepID=A0A194Q827_PAPXU|nr:hypothetical protein RR46_08715 [Papilio xuthus]